MANPFEYDAANNLPVEDLLEIFVEDHNFSRFICAPRNVFLVGERGSGKSMMLRYNSLPVKSVYDRERSGSVRADFVGVLVECNAPLYARRMDDFSELDEFTTQLISEHLFVADIGQALVKALRSITDILDDDDLVDTQDALSVFYSVELNTYGKNFLDRLERFFGSMSVHAQRALNSPTPDLKYSELITFSSAIVPLLEELRRLPALKASHFMLMIDDAQNLSRHQRRTLNSWIAYRSQTIFSFKVGAAKSEYMDFLTNNGSPILQGHDFITLDMEQPFQNQNSDFAKFSEKVIAKRLVKLSKDFESSSPDPAQLVRKFFPTSAAVETELEECRGAVEAEFLDQNPTATSKQVRDWGYKYGRVKYFRERHPKAGLPSYSGFDTIAHASTGVIRGLLEPCYYMYDEALSASSSGSVQEISSEIQSKILKEKSDDLWQRVGELHKHVRDCTEDDAADINRLLEALGSYFQTRLLRHKSEPRILAFTISAIDGTTDEQRKRLRHLLHLCRAARLLYIRRGVSRDRRKRETYYVPDRLLWPSYGLDVIGQHGRASIKAQSLVLAVKGIAIPTDFLDKKDTDELELTDPSNRLFDD